MLHFWHQSIPQQNTTFHGNYAEMWGLILQHTAYVCKFCSTFKPFIQLPWIHWHLCLPKHTSFALPYALKSPPVLVYFSPSHPSFLFGHHFLLSNMLKDRLEKWVRLSDIWLSLFKSFFEAQTQALCWLAHRIMWWSTPRLHSWSSSVLRVSQ